MWQKSVYAWVHKQSEIMLVKKSTMNGLHLLT
uniref:Uncharacterized protein n=1 Tax=Rhizophora mucronata TaxID=61149 RepID=A0A2P2QCU0_RHIMU